MATGAGLKIRIDKALNKVTPVNQVIYKRLVTTSGDTLIGRATSTVIDTILSPQPSITQAGRQHLSGKRDAVETVINTEGRVVRDDYILTISTTAVTADELANPNLFFVFKSGSAENVLFVMDYSPIEYQGTIIVHEVYARSVKTT